MGQPFLVVPFFFRTFAEKLRNIVLFESFKLSVLFYAGMCLIDMINSGSYDYVLLPICIAVWGLYGYFKTIDDDILSRRGIDPENYSIFADMAGDYDDIYYTGSTTYRPPVRFNTNTQYNRTYSAVTSKKEDEEIKRQVSSLLMSKKRISITRNGVEETISDNDNKPKKKKSMLKKFLGGDSSEQFFTASTIVENKNNGAEKEASANVRPETYY